MNIKKIHEQLGIDNQPFSIRKIHENIAYEQAQREWEKIWEKATKPNVSFTTDPTNFLRGKEPLTLTFEPVKVLGQEDSWGGIPETAPIVTAEQWDAIERARNVYQMSADARNWANNEWLDITHKHKEDVSAEIKKGGTLLDLWNIGTMPTFLIGHGISDVKKSSDAKNTHTLDWDDTAIMALKEVYDTQGEAAAIQFAKDYNQALDAGELEEWAANNGIMGSIVSLLTSALSGVETVGNYYAYGSDVFSPREATMYRNEMEDATKYLRAGRASAIDWNVGDFDVFDFVYNTGMTMADQGIDYLITRGTGKLSKGVSKAASTLMGIFPGLRAAGSASNDILSRGGTSGQAAFGGVIVGILEGLFEKYSIGELKSFKTASGKTFKELFEQAGKASWKTLLKESSKDFLKSTAVNTSEEALTELTSLAFDTIAMGDVSTYATKVEDYVAQGMTKEEARTKALTDLAFQVIEAGASGALMGAVYGPIGTVSAYKGAKKALGYDIKPKNKTYQGIKELSAAPDKKDAFQKAMEKAGGYETLSKDQKSLKTLGQVVGVKVKFANLDVKREDGSIFSPDGQYDKDTNTITLNTSEAVKHNPVAFVLKHEITHSIENLAPERYADLASSILNSNLFRDWVQAEKGFETVEEYRADIMRRYTEQGVKGFEGQEGQVNASKEMVANFVGDVLFGGREDIAAKLINGMAPKQKKTFIEWVKDIFKTLRQKFTGNVTMAQEIDRLENLFLNAARETKSIRQNKSAQTETIAEEKTETEKTPEKDKTEIKEEAKPEKEVEQTAEEKAKPEKEVGQKKAKANKSKATETAKTPVLQSNAKDQQKTTTEEVKYSVSQPAVEKLTETQYNNFGWVRANDVLTPAEYSVLLSNYAGHKHKDDYFPVTRFGETVLHSSQYNDILMYVKGNIRSPKITKIVKIEADEANVKEVILRYEREKNPRALEIVENYFGEWILDAYYREDYDDYRKYRAEQKRRDSQNAYTVGRTEQDRGRSSSKNHTDDSLSFSLPALDNEYMSAVERGDMETAQRLVEAEARKAGYSIEAYHGTGTFGFTTFRDGNIYATTSIGVAMGYNRGQGLGRVRSSSKHYIKDDGTVETLVKNAKNVLGYNIHKITSKEQKQILEDFRKSSAELNNKINDVWTGEAVDSIPFVEELTYTDEYGYEYEVSLDNAVSWVLSLAGEIDGNIDTYGEETSVYYNPISSLEESIRNFKKYHPILRNYFVEHHDEMKGTPAYELYKLVVGYELTDFVIDAEYKFLRSFDSNNMVVDETGGIITQESARDAIESQKDVGIYHLYGKKGNKPLIIDEGNVFWDAIPFQGAYRSTDYISKWARDNGYTSVLFKTVLDPSSGGSANVYADEYVFFSPNDVKSADPVTYDDNGNVIPLSERFNVENNDIRYSLPESDRIPIGSKVRAGDRGNIGTVTYYNETLGEYTVSFTSKKGATASKTFPVSMLTPLGVSSTKGKSRSTASRVSAKNLIEKYDRGEITQDEVVNQLRESTLMNPVEIANLTPEDADTTPDLKPKEDRSIAPVQALARKKLGVEGGDRIAAMIEDFGGQPRSDLIDVANNILENLPDKPDTRKKEDKLLLARRIRETEESLNRAIKKVKKDYGTRKSWESFSESDIITDEVKDLIAKDGYIQNYGRTTNKRTLGKALELLEEEGRERVEKFMKMPPEEANAVDVAVGLILLERYQRAGKFTSAQAVAQKLSEIGTISGQTVQIFSVIGRFSPEMMVQYAQRELDKAFEILVENKTKAWVDKHAEEFQLTPEDVDFIKNCTIVASQLEDGSRMKAVLLAQASQRVSDKIPPSAGDSIRAFQRISLLLNFRTFGRNLLGNVSMIPAYVSSDFFGNLIDKQLAKKSNIRTTGNVRLGDKDLGRAFWKGAVESWDDFKRGIHTRQEELNRFDVNVKQGKAFNENHEKLKILNGFSRAANALDNFTSFTLELGDRPFFEMWLVNSLKNQMALNKTDTPTAEMLEIAKQEALQRTWQDTNAWTRTVGKLKEVLNKVPLLPGKSYGLGDVVLKFVKTPANIAKAIIDFSPLGGIKAITSGKKYTKALASGNLTPAMQKEFVRSASNAITGTLFYVLIAVLANAGVLELSGAGDEDKDVANFEKYVAGVHPYSMKIFGQWIPYEWNQPVGAVLAAVADIMENTDYEHQNIGDYANDAWNAMKAAGTVFTQQSFLTNLEELFSQEDIMTGLLSVATSEPSAFIPQLLAQTASFTDPYRRTTYVSKDPIATALNGIMNRIPGLRQMLPAQVNVLGEEAENTQYLNPWLAFASPYNLYPKVSGEVAEELYELYGDTENNSVIPPVVQNSFTVKGVEVTFTPEEKADFQKKVGKLSADILEEMFDSDEYKKLDDEQKIKAVKAVYSYATDKAKTELDIFDYDLVKEMEGKKSNGDYVLTKDKWNRIGRKGQQILIDEYFLTKKQRATKGDTKKLAEMFIESAADK